MEQNAGITTKASFIGKVIRPAFELPDGSKAWMLNGNLHRETGPAIEWANGFKEWYV